MTNQHDGPHLTPINPLLERAPRSLTGEGRGQAAGRWRTKASAPAEARKVGG